MEERIAVALLDLADKFGLPDARGTIINVQFGHRNIAELVSGSAPQSQRMSEAVGVGWRDSSRSAGGSSSCRIS